MYPDVWVPMVYKAGNPNPHRARMEQSISERDQYSVSNPVSLSGEFSLAGGAIATRQVPALARPRAEQHLGLPEPAWRRRRSGPGPSGSGSPETLRGYGHHNNNNINNDRVVLSRATLTAGSGSEVSWGGVI